MAGYYWLCPQCGEPIEQDPELTEGDEYDDAPCAVCVQEQDEDDARRKV